MVLQLEADPVLLESAEWWLEVGCWWTKLVKQNISRHRGGQEDKRVGSEVASLGGPPAAHLAAYLCATQWMTVGWPPWGGCPLAAVQQADNAIFVG